MDFGLGSKTPGTCVKVIQYSPGDAYLVLYLLESGIYLFIVYWQGFELTVAAGVWNEENNNVKVDGVGATLY
ncbi:MAG: hypothetical protein CVU43_22170 [Chloroflexi bacterium HGW-Chloroflexi-5]|jgi:hypothetical protein|nr:MAG: hypothetical protein CVU54_12935 [Deltaproteobacteria bacterium HGW-Deltaproteobacteria-12]PKN96158.1 MAG: hypothetical protein CVU43_22170 [Chloroflexi bacterium HGW-Chloroflexi-5]